MVIVCTYNEKENIEPLTQKIFDSAPESHMLIIDDNSPDGTGALADALAAADPRVRVIHRPGKQGLGTAQVQGLLWARDNGYDTAVTMDADFSHDPSAIPAMLALRPVYDYIIGSRYVPGGRTVKWGPHRVLLSRCANLFAKTLLRLPVNDLTTGYRCLNLQCLDRIGVQNIRAQGYGFFIETTFRVVRAGVTPREVPITFIDRQFGVSKISRIIIAEAFFLVLRLWREGKKKSKLSEK